MCVFFLYEKNAEILKTQTYYENYANMLIPKRILDKVDFLINGRQIIRSGTRCFRRENREGDSKLALRKY